MNRRTRGPGQQTQRSTQRKRPSDPRFEKWKRANSKRPRLKIRRPEIDWRNYAKRKRNYRNIRPYGRSENELWSSGGDPQIGKRETNWVFEWNFTKRKINLDLENFFGLNLKYSGCGKWLETGSDWTLKVKVWSREVVWINGVSTFLQ